jgi:hypothetical protein
MEDSLGNTLGLVFLSRASVGDYLTCPYTNLIVLVCSSSNGKAANVGNQESGIRNQGQVVEDGVVWLRP